jgi:hypothetical protein
MSDLSQSWRTALAFALGIGGLYVAAQIGFGWFGCFLGACSLLYVVVFGRRIFKSLASAAQS